METKPYKVEIKYHSSEQVYEFETHEKAVNFAEKARNIGHDAQVLN